MTPEPDLTGSISLPAFIEPVQIRTLIDYAIRELGGVTQDLGALDRDQLLAACADAGLEPEKSARFNKPFTPY